MMWDNKPCLATHGDAHAKSSYIVSSLDDRDEVSILSS